MKMIYVGSLATTPDRDSGWIREFSNLGWDVVSFGSDCNADAKGVVAKIRRRLHVGHVNREMQRALLDLITQEKPAWVHFRLPINFDRQTILAIKKLSLLLLNTSTMIHFQVKNRLGCTGSLGKR